MQFNSISKCSHWITFFFWCTDGGEKFTFFISHDDEEEAMVKKFFHGYEQSYNAWSQKLFKLSLYLSAYNSPHTSLTLQTFIHTQSSNKINIFLALKFFSRIYLHRQQQCSALWSMHATRMNEIFIGWIIRRKRSMHAFMVHFKKDIEIDISTSFSLCNWVEN